MDLSSSGWALRALIRRRLWRGQLSYHDTLIKKNTLTLYSRVLTTRLTSHKPLRNNVWSPRYPRLKRMLFTSTHTRCHRIRVVLIMSYVAPPYIIITRLRTSSLSTQWILWQNRCACVHPPAPYGSPSMAGNFYSDPKFKSAFAGACAAVRIFTKSEKLR